MNVVPFPYIGPLWYAGHHSDAEDHSKRAGSGAGDAKCWARIAREGQETDDSTNGDEYRNQDDPGQQTWMNDDCEGQGEGTADITALNADQRYSRRGLTIQRRWP